MMDNETNNYVTIHLIKFFSILRIKIVRARYNNIQFYLQTKGMKWGD